MTFKLFGYRITLISFCNVTQEVKNNKIYRIQNDDGTFFADDWFTIFEARNLVSYKDHQRILLWGKHQTS